MKKGTFILYDVDLQAVRFLSDEQAGKLFKALAKYRLKGEYPDFAGDSALNILFHQISEHIAINEEKYRETCRKNAESAKKRWNNQNSADTMPTHAQACERIKSDAKLCLYDTETDTDTVNVYDTETDTDACGAKRKTKKDYYSQRNKTAYQLNNEPSYDMDAFTKKALNLKYIPPNKKEHIT